MFFAVAELVDWNNELTFVALVLGIIALVLWIITWMIAHFN